MQPRPRSSRPGPSHAAEHAGQAENHQACLVLDVVSKLDLTSGARAAKEWMAVVPSAAVSTS